MLLQIILWLGFTDTYTEIAEDTTAEGDEYSKYSEQPETIWQEMENTIYRHTKNTSDKTLKNQNYQALLIINQLFF